MSIPIPAPPCALHCIHPWSVFGRRAAACLLIAVSQTLQLHAVETRPPWPQTMVESASLNAVHCIDSQSAWAVGERGVILSTKDGGQTWTAHPQALTDSSLSDVSFADEQNGVIVGGQAQPYQLPSSATILRTTDAGQTWQLIDRTMLPQLRKVESLEKRTVVAIGDASPLFLSGLFRSQDGGRSWNCMPTGSQHDWVAGDLRQADPILINTDGESARCLNCNIMKSAPDPLLVEKSLRDVAWVSEEHAFAVGDDGIALHSFDGGKTWQRNPALAQHPIAQQIDFRSVFAKNGMIWIAGSPGTHVFRSHDSGRTWDVATTGQSLPIRSLDFSDPQHGIGAGDFGVIMVTSDAGTTWRVTRGQGRRAGILIACASAADVPLDLIAQLSAVDQLRCTVLIAAQPTEQFNAAAAAARLVGADQVERIAPLQSGATDCRLVRRLVAYRPDIVVISESAAGVTRLTDAAISALRTVGDPQQLASLCGNEFDTWRVQRVFRAAAATQTTVRPITIKTAEPVVALNSSIAAAVTEASGYVGTLAVDDSNPQAAQHLVSGRSFTTLSQAVWPEQAPDATFIGGLELPYDSASRRPMVETPPHAPTIYRRAATYHNSLSLIDRLIHLDQQQQGKLEQLAPLTRDLQPREQSCLLLWAAEQCHRHGRTDIALETLDALVQRQTDDIYQQAAVLQRLKYSHSAEIAIMLKRRPSTPTPKPFAAEGTTVQSAAYLSPPVAIAVDATQSNSDRGLTGPSDPESILKLLPPTTQALPWVRMAAASIRRTTASPKERARIYKLVKNKMADVNWIRCAAIESWLADMKPNPQRPIPPFVIILQGASVPPILDGQLNDRIWQDASPLHLWEPNSSDSPSDHPTTVRLARDGSYLFIALQCQTASPPKNHSEVTQQRDSDLSQSDHVDLYFDVDRDYSTGWQLSVDCRGWANDACDGNPAWNPRWHIATRVEDSSWTAEMAIPLSELADPTRLTNRCTAAWLLGIRRRGPEIATQVWPDLADEPFRWQQCGYVVLNDRISGSN